LTSLCLSARPPARLRAGKMFIRLQQLCEDTPQDFKNVPNLVALTKIKGVFFKTHIFCAIVY
jgi:hypothetical protein